MASRSLTAVTINERLAKIKALFKVLMGKGVVSVTEAQLRSKGQAAEATYWIPVLMFYTGARTEEIAGLALADIAQDHQGRWYFNLVVTPMTCRPFSRPPFSTSSGEGRSSLTSKPRGTAHCFRR